MSLAEKPWFRTLLVTIAGRKHLRRFQRDSHELQKTQSELLLRMVQEGRDTAFGRDHGFDTIRSVDDYRAAVPIRDFEGHRPYVDRMIHGERDILFPGKPIIYNTTSGTTNQPKMIPISQRYFDQSVSQMNKVWLYSVMADNPHIYDGKSLSAVAPAEEGRVEDGTPYGSVSGMGYRNIPAVLKSTHAATYPVICIRDYLDKYYTMVRLALEHDITFIISPSPSNVLRWHQTVMEQFEELMRDIRDGTLRERARAGLPDDGRDEVLRTLKPNPGRVKELEALYASHGNGLRPRHYWPNISCVNLWKQGNFAQMLPKLDDYFPESTVRRAFGYQASEGRVGLVLSNEWDCSVLAHYVYHVEFMPEEERGSDTPRTLLAHEVENGRRYFLIFTNGSGLYRYDINDLVEVVGWYNRLPLFTFIQKGEGVTSLTGEKLAEPQVIHAVTAAAEETRAAVENYLMCCDETDMRYKCYVEFSADASPDARRTFSESLDRHLALVNREYEGKRGSERLAPPQVLELRANSIEEIRQARIARRMGTAGQYKDVYLTRKPEFIQILDGLRRT